MFSTLEAVRLSPLTYAVRASTPACICVQTIKDWVRDELKRLVDKKLTPAPTGAGDEESTEEQRLLDEAVDNFQEALDIERAKRQSLSKQSEREAVTAAGLISEDEAISNMASAPSEFGLQRALVRALVHDPGDASWNHSAGDDKDSGGREVQPRAAPLLLRLSFVRQADRHLVASQDLRMRLRGSTRKANSLANSIQNRHRAKS